MLRDADVGVSSPRDARGVGARAAAFAGVAGDAPLRGVGGGQSAQKRHPRPGGVKCERRRVNC